MLARIVHGSCLLRTTGIALLLAGCATRLESTTTGRAPILCGKLVDADGRARVGYEFCVNIRDSAGTAGGMMVVTDANGEFRIDSLTPLCQPADSHRQLLLVGHGGEQASADVTRGFPDGVHYLGELTMADPWDGRPLQRLSDKELFATLEQEETQNGVQCVTRNEGRVDACLRECARRGSPATVDYLTTRLANGVRGSVIWRTALRRAQRRCDPLSVELPGMRERDPLHCTIGSLPTVEVLFFNRDVESCTLVGFEGLAIECLDSPERSGSHRLIGRGLEPQYGSGIFMEELAPGTSVTHPVPIGGYIEIQAPG